MPYWQRGPDAPKRGPFDWDFYYTTVSVFGTAGCP